MPQNIDIYDITRFFLNISMGFYTAQIAIYRLAQFCICLVRLVSMVDREVGQFVGHIY